MVDFCLKVYKKIDILHDKMEVFKIKNIFYLSKLKFLKSLQKILKNNLNKNPFSARKMATMAKFRS